MEKKNHSKELKVRRQKVFDALSWLTAIKTNGGPNNFLYKDIKIDMERLTQLPENGFLDFPDREIESSDKDQENDTSEQNENDIPDLGPVEQNEERVFDENSEMGSFMPSKIETSKESTKIREDIIHPLVNELDIGIEPINEFNTPFLASLAFPTLFPDTKGEPTNPALIRNIARSDTESFSEKLKHLVKFGEIEKGKWFYRFTSHPRFAFWGFNMLYRKRLLSQGNFT